MAVKKIKLIKTEVDDLTKSIIEFTENVLEEKVQNLAEQIREKYEWQLNPEQVHIRLANLEDRSRRNNLIQRTQDIF